MNDYITIDSKKYRTPNKNWKPAIDPMGNSRVLANGNLDIVHGPTTVYFFQGEIEADVTPDAGFGSPTDLRATLAKKQAFSLTDHYGTSYNCHLIGPFPERGLSPKWDSASNIIYFSVHIKATKVVA